MNGWASPGKDLTVGQEIEDEKHLHLVQVLCEVGSGQCLGPSQLSILWYPLEGGQGSRRQIILKVGNGIVCGDARICSDIAQHSEIRKHIRH